MRLGPRPRELQGLGHGQPRQRAAADGVGDGDLHVHGFGQARGGGVGGGLRRLGGWGGWGGWELGEAPHTLGFYREFRPFPLWFVEMSAGSFARETSSHLNPPESSCSSIVHPLFIHFPSSSPRWPWSPRSGCWSSPSTPAPRPPRRAARRPNAWWTRWSRCRIEPLLKGNGGTLRTGWSSDIIR